LLYIEPKHNLVAYCILELSKTQTPNHHTTAIINTMATFSSAFARQPDCMLLEKLPRNTREEIIRLAIVSEDVYIEPGINWRWNERTCRSSGRIEFGHHLLETCKQLRQESAKIFFLDNIFVVSCNLSVANRDTPWFIQSQAYEMAVATFARAFGCYASKVSILGVRLTIEFEPELDVEVDINIERCEGGPGVWISTVDANIVSDDEFTPDVQVCSCRISQFAADQASASESVFEFAQSYVRWMHMVMEEPRVVECWSCGLKRLALPFRRLCAEARVDGPGPGDGAALSASPIGAT
jgi:hypothetical protein